MLEIAAAPFVCIYFDYLNTLGLCTGGWHNSSGTTFPRTIPGIDSANAGGTAPETLRGSQIPWIWEASGAHHAPGTPCEASRGGSEESWFSMFILAAHLRVGRELERAGDENEES